MYVESVDLRILEPEEVCYALSPRSVAMMTLLLFSLCGGKKTLQV